MQKVRIKAVGDILLRSDGKGLHDIASFLDDADIVIGTLETPLSSGGWRMDKLFTFRCNPERAQELASHFDVLSLANNHSMDFGYLALEDTIRNLGKLGTLTVGAGSTLQDASKAVFVKRGAISVGFMAVTTLLPIGIRASEDRPGVAGIRIRTSYEIAPGLLQEEPGMPPTVRTCVVPEDQMWLEKLVGSAANQCDSLVIISHMGYGADRRLLEFERPFAESLLKAGAACVLGDHVHAIRGATFGPSGMVIYGLNNFIKQAPLSQLSEEQNALVEAQGAIAGGDAPYGLVASIDVLDGRVCGGEFKVAKYSESGLPTRPSQDEADFVLNDFRTQCASLGWSPEWDEFDGLLRWRS